MGLMTHNSKIKIKKNFKVKKKKKRGEGDSRGGDGWMPSPIQRT